VKCEEMSIELRALEPGDAARHRTLMNQAFGKGRVVTPPAPDAPPPDMANKYGVFEDGALRAALTIVPFVAHWGAEFTLPLGGIAGVATFAEARGQGHVDALLRHSLKVMHDAGQVISALYPFAWSFYKRYGWEWVGENRRITLPLREIRVSAKSISRIQDITGDSAQAAITPAYNAFAKQYRGVFTTETHRWENLLRHDDSRTTYVYQHGDDGYLLWRYGNDDTGTVREMVANSPDAWESSLALLHYFATQCEKARVSLPADTPLYSYLMHYDVKTEVEPVFMGRVVDVSAALAALKPAPDITNGSLLLAVQDPHAPWNDGQFRVTVEDGQVQCAAQLGGTSIPDVTLSIGAFSQAYWGRPSLYSLRQAGQVTVTSEAGYQLLHALLPAATVYCRDDF
jgi:predicted acetyltransferase